MLNSENTTPEPLVLLSAHVTQTARDRFAAAARARGQKMAAYLRELVEGAIGDVAAPDPVPGSVQRMTVRLRDDTRAKLIDFARTRRSTPTRAATWVLESVLGDRAFWSGAEQEEMRALYLELKAVEASTTDRAVLDPLRVAMQRVLRNLQQLKPE